MDILRLAVTEVDAEAGGGFQVEVYVNEVEMTSAGAGLGMDPYSVLIPVNRFIPADTTTTIPIARCGCGVYGCGMTDVKISSEGDQVRWDWEKEVPMPSPVFFDRDIYRTEIARMQNDHSWEPPERTAGRLLLSSVQSEELPGGLEFDWVGNDWRDSSRFQVCLQIRGEYQVFVNFDWTSRSPVAMALEVRRALLEDAPAAWAATWHSIKPGGGPPAFAGPKWERHRLYD